MVYLKLTFHSPKCGFDPSIKLYGYKMGAGQLGMNITMDTVDVIINNTEINLLFKDSVLFVNCISCQ